MANDFDKGILDRLSHRPWPMPDRPWVMTQTWHRLLFAHWPVETDDLRKLVPPVFELDTFAGRTWLGIVPFHMTNVAPRGVVAVPWISEFPELNVRTYVRVGDRPGIYFFSLDAGSRIAVKTARLLLNLPYFTAAMTLSAAQPRVDFESVREGTGPAAQFHAWYEPTGSPEGPVEGSLEYFLTERYCLYNVDHQDRPYRLEIHHPPWPLQTAAAGILRNTMAEAAGIPLPAIEPLLHFSRRQDMVAWGPSALE